MTIDERLEALTMNMELAWREIEAQRGQTEKVLTGIEKLLRIAESHERRIADLENGGE
ncbi:MAG: hypothetical protein ACR2I2_21295 [Bryobacteraceae bacterium]